MPNIEKAIELVERADVFVVIGTSLVVYPAAGLIQCVRPGVPIYYIDPNPASTAGVPNVTVIKATATEGMRRLAEILEKRGEIERQRGLSVGYVFKHIPKRWMPRKKY